MAYDTTGIIYLLLGIDHGRAGTAAPCSRVAEDRINEFFETRDARRHE